MNISDECKVILSLFQLGTRGIEKECIKKQCRSGKAICLSKEQVFLLNLMIDSSLQWDIQDDNIEILEENYPAASFLCPGYSGEGSPLLHIPENKDGLLCILTDHLADAREWQIICEPVSVVLGINSYRKIVDRKTLVHLCMNSQEGALLFRRILMKSIELLVINWENELKMQAIANFFLKFLGELSVYDDAVHEELAQNIDRYRDIMRSRIEGGRLDILYDKFSKTEWGGNKNGSGKVNILDYFSMLEGKRCEYYTSRIMLMNYIFSRRGMSCRVPSALVDSAVSHRELDVEMNNGERLETNRKNKDRIQEIIDLIARQEDVVLRENWIAELGNVIRNSLDEWIDEDVLELHKKVSSVK